MSKWLALLLCVPWLAWAGPSRHLDGGGPTVGDHFEVATTVANGFPVTLACWINTDTAHDGTPMTVGQIGAARHHQIELQDTDALAYGESHGTGPDPSIATGNTLTEDGTSWHHVAYVSRANNDRLIQLDGDEVNEGTNTQTVNLQNLEEIICVGALRRADFRQHFDGHLAHCAVWGKTGADLTDAELDELAAGQWTSWVVTEALVAFWPMWSDDPNGDEQDLSVSGIDQIALNTPIGIGTTGPPVFFPIGGM